LNAGAQRLDQLRPPVQQGVECADRRVGNTFDCGIVGVDDKGALVERCRLIQLTAKEVAIANTGMGSRYFLMASKLVMPRQRRRGDGQCGAFLQCRAIIPSTQKVLNLGEARLDIVVLRDFMQRCGIRVNNLITHGRRQNDATEWTRFDPHRLSIRLMMRLPRFLRHLTVLLRRAALDGRHSVSVHRLASCSKGQRPKLARLCGRRFLPLLITRLSRPEVKSRSNTS
jgi:hypothetical protein